MNQPNIQGLECAVCLQKCNYPTQLPCGHIFCFLCVKGVAIQSKRCALCRAEIPPDYLDNPDVLAASEYTSAPYDSKEYQWFYEGTNGWWKYDEQSNDDLESAYNNGEAQCKLLLAGALYHIDFQRMIQMQSRDPRKRRRVRRDTPMLPAKGVAGVKITEIRQRRQTRSENEESNNDVNSVNEIIAVDDDDSDDDIQTENTATNVPQTNNVLGDIMRRFGQLYLQGPNTHENSSRNPPAEEDS